MFAECCDAVWLMDFGLWCGTDWWFALVYCGFERGCFRCFLVCGLGLIMADGFGVGCSAADYLGGLWLCVWCCWCLGFPLWG